MKIKRLEPYFSVCKVRDFSKINIELPFCFTAVTEEENSLVCRTQDVPENVTEREDGWRGMRIEGVLDFSLIGILARIAAILAREEIGIFVISTYNTDYIFTKDAQYERAVQALRENGYEMV